ncbi:MAG TPA: hypothetical protein VKW06_16185 [Candidatus Angelobacter sp.]|nr:hypothetical protein [Candidatus Angelobacter sp.]
MSQNVRSVANTQIENKILSAVDSVVQQMASVFDEIGRATIGRNTTTYLAINSSFLSREKQIFKTNQSQRRIVVELSATGKKVSVGRISACDDTSVKNHYKVLSTKETAHLISLTDAVAQELATVGDLIFVLIGTMKGLRPDAHKVETASVKELRLLPSLPDPDIQRIAPGVYAIKKIVPPEDLLEVIARDLEKEGGLSLESSRAIADVYDRLSDAAITDVVLPTAGVHHPDDTVLGKILASLRNQADEYKEALKKLEELPDDSKSLNEVLRLAYNFSSDTVPLISLFTSICDLKPLVFWCTIKQHWALYRAFAALPWSALGRKEKLSEYQSIVSNARSYAFHHVLPFDSTVEVDLSQANVRADKIRLFLPFRETRGRGVHMKDQQLVDVLAEFSRAKLRPASTSFWKANLRVMEQACQLAEHILDALVLIHHSRKT